MVSSNQRIWARQALHQAIVINPRTNEWIWIGMIVFYRAKNCPACGATEEVLKELCISHKVVIVENKQQLPQALASNVKLPILVDEEKIIQGSKNIINYLSDLEKFKEQWYKFQSDTCYCDETGSIE